VAALFLAVVALCAVVGQLWTLGDPYQQDPLLAVSGPSLEHPLGTDDLGRDVLARVVDGTLGSVAGPLCVALGTFVVGTGLGLIAGYYGGRRDSVITLVADAVYSLPFLLIAIVVVGVVGTGYWLTVALLVALMFPASLRLVRSTARVQARLPYIEAARTLGVRDRRVMAVHLLPNVAPTVSANALLDFVTAMIAVSALAFLGLGSEPGGSAWGTMLSDGQDLIYQNPLMSLAPALLIVVTCVSTTVIGDWLFDRLSDQERR
jgi:peptide/nickel transport system permease protein/glutathione transport system permease protein